MAHNSERHKNKLSSFVLEVKSVSSVSPSSPSGLVFKFPPGFSGWCTSNYKSNKLLLQIVLIHGVYYINIDKTRILNNINKQVYFSQLWRLNIREQATSRLAVW